MQKFRINKLTALDHAKRALKRREKNKAGGLLSIQIEVKTDKPTNWKALWIRFGAPSVRKTTVVGVTCLSTGQVGVGSVD